MDFFKKYPKAVVGMIHCLPLPGTPNFKNNLPEVKKQALEDALVLKEAGFTCIMIENMGDVPYQETLELEQITALTAIAQEIKEKVDLPLGIDCAFSDYKASLAIAKAVGAEFIRIPVFVDTVIFSGGIIYPSNREALVYRKHLQAEDIAILVDIQVKHTYMLNPNVTLEESAKLAEANGADAIVVTGVLTGVAASNEDLRKIKNLVKIPVYVGSGVNHKNIKEQLEIVDGMIVGSSIKPQGKVELPVDYELAKSLIAEIK
jgi:membrane complex biogenesis BtpA family protein